MCFKGHAQNDIATKFSLDKTFTKPSYLCNYALIYGGPEARQCRSITIFPITNWLFLVSNLIFNFQFGVFPISNSKFSHVYKLIDLDTSMWVLFAGVLSLI